MRSRRPPRRTLSPDAIVEAAMAVLDEGGVDSLNMRAVADRLGKAPWQDQLKDAIRAIRSGLGAHRDLARASLGTIPTGPNALRWVNGVLGVLRDGGLPEDVIAYAVDILPLYPNATAFESPCRDTGSRSATTTQTLRETDQRGRAGTAPSPSPTPAQ